MAKGKHELKKTKTTEHKPEKKAAPKEKKAEKKTAKKSDGKAKTIVLTVVIALIVLIAAAFVTALLVGRSATIHPNVQLNGTDVGGLTVQEAEAALTADGWEAQADAAVTVTLPGEYRFTVSTAEAGLKMNSREAAEAAYKFGHSGDPIADIIAYFKCVFGRVSSGDILSAATDGKGIAERVKTELKAYGEFLDRGYELDLERSEMRILKGAKNVKIDEGDLCDKIIAAFENEESECSYTVEIADADEIDFTKIHKEIFSEVKESVYDRETKQPTESAVGVDFEIAAAKAVWDKAAPGELAIIPLTVTQPKYSAEELGKMLFRDKLGSQTTDYSTSAAGRATNVELAADKINGVILNPGESFDYNKTVGQRTTAAGFKAASAYSGGKVVQEVGGGICQVSSTLYCAALYANLQIDARDCHHFAVGYVPPGLDATVSWGGPEFKFTNNRDLPVKIVTTHSGGKITVEIWGTDLDGSYVKMEYSSGTGSNGTSATTYRCVYDKNDKLISRELEAKSFYYFHVEEEPEPSPSPSPSPTPTPTPSPEPSTEPTMPPEPTTEPAPEE